MTEQEIHDRLVALSKQQQYVKELQAAYEALFATVMAPVQKLLNEAAASEHEQDEKLRTDFLAHVEAGGDPQIHDSVEFRRTTTFVYDKHQALDYCQENDLAQFIRVKNSLIAVPFKKACQDGEINYPDGETVNQPSVSIRKLGHLLIGDGGRSEL
jgi:hypothetical protein